MSTNITVKGQLQDVYLQSTSSTELNLYNKKIEIWQKKGAFDELVGYSTTIEKGEFNIDLIHDDDSTPIVYFKVFDEQTPLMITLDPIGFPNTIVNELTLSNTSVEVVIFADIPFDLLQGVSPLIELHFRLLKEDNVTRVSYQNTNLKIFKNSDLVADLGNVYSNNLGYVKYFWENNKNRIVDYQNDPSLFEFRLLLIDKDDVIISSSSIQGNQISDFTKTYDITFSIAPELAITNSKSITDLSTELSITIEAPVLSYLLAKNLTNLNDLRSIGGLRNQNEIKEATFDQCRETIQILDAHAQFEIISRDHIFNQKIVNAGYYSVHQVARLDRSTFVSAIAGEEKYDALIFHRTAFAAAAVFSNVYTERLVNRHDSNQPIDTLQNVLNEIEEKCSCDDCETATSPFAYLVDLMDYANKHLLMKFNPSIPNGFENGFVNIGDTKEKNDLELLFCQKYSQIPVACDELHHKVCQYRIAIEVLQCYKQKNPPIDDCCNSTFIKAEKDFFLSLYHALLEQAGTSYYQLRDIQGNTTAMDKMEEQLAVYTIDPVHIDNRPVKILFKSNAEINNLSAQQLFTFIENTFGFLSVYRQPYYDAPASTPLLELWRKAYLRKKWMEDDSVSDEYSRHEKLIVDPDLIGLDDIKLPHHSSNPIYLLWEDRRNLLDDIWKNDFNANPNWFNAGIKQYGGVIQTTNAITGITAGDNINLIINGGTSAIEVIPLTVKRVVDYFVETLEKIHVNTVTANVEIVKGSASFGVDSWFNYFSVELSTSVLGTDYNATNQLKIWDNSSNPVLLGTFDTYIPISVPTFQQENIFLLKGDWGLGLNYGSVSLSPNFTSAIAISAHKYDTPNLVSIFELLCQLPTGSTSKIPQHTWLKIDTSSNSLTAYDFPSTGTTLQEQYLNWFNLFSSHINGTNKTNRENAIARIPIYFNLSLESFMRLVELYKKFVAQENNAANPTLVKDEIEEIFNILLLSVKNKKTPTWLIEESAIKLSATRFYKSLREPKVGSLPIVFRSDEVALDPETIALNDLPEYAASGIVTTLLNDRLNYILSKRADYIGTTAPTLASFKDVLYDVYGHIYPASVVIVISSVTYYPLLLDFENTNTQLVSINSAVANAAKYKIETSLKLTIPAFNAIMSVLSRLKSGALISTEEFSSVIKPLVSAKKIFEKYPTWISEESTASVNLRSMYWFSRKMTMPKWLTSSSDRLNWQRSLAAQSNVPIIDPDMVSPSDIVKVTHPAFDLWAQRKITLQTKLNGIQASLNNVTFTTNLQKFEETVKLGLDISDMQHYYMIADLEEAREDIKPYLFRLNLTVKAYRRLKQLQHVMLDIGYANMVSDEIADFKDILLQATKIRKLYYTWSKEEDASSIVLSPEVFAIKAVPYGGDADERFQKLNEWRASYSERKKWEKKLKARKNQFVKVTETIETANDSVEADLLRVYRDALILQLGDKTKTLAQNAETFSHRLLLDFTLNCCQHTTRLAQAIDTLQKLIWEESIGIDRDILIGADKLSFSLNSDRFEEEWKWMGSYATWRSAMFVFMFPENLLLPSLKKYQSKVFQDIASDIRGNNRFTPKAACKAIAQYTSYMEDLSKLVPSATCTTDVPYFGDRCANSNVRRWACTFFSFAVTEVSRRVYFSTKDYNGNEIEDFSFWNPIDALQANVTAILGSPVYRMKSDTKFIYLFATIKEEEAEKLVFVKYNVNNRNWDTDFTELDLPENTDFKDIQILQRQREDAPPKILVRIKETGELYSNELNEFGKKLASSKWTLISTGSKRSKLATLKAFAEITASDSIEEFILGVNLDKGHYIYRLLGVNDEGMWKKATNFSGKFKGLVNTNTNKRCIGFFYEQMYQPNLFVTKQVTIKLGKNTLMNGRFKDCDPTKAPKYSKKLADYGIKEQEVNRIASFDQLDWWLISHFGRGLYHCLADLQDLGFYYGGYLLGGVDTDNNSSNDVFWNNFKQLANWSNIPINGNYEMHNPSLNYANYPLSVTYRDIFQSFQFNYQQIRKINQVVADNDGRGFCDWLKKWLIDNLLKNSSSDNYSIAKAFHFANLLLQKIDAPFYTSEPDKDDYHGKELNLENILTSLLNFTFDSEGKVYLRGKDYPELYVTILGQRSDFVLEENFNFLQDAESVNPNWGLLYGIGEGGTKNNWALFYTYLSINKLNNRNRAIVQKLDTISTRTVKEFNNEGEWIFCDPIMPSAPYGNAKIDQLIDVWLYSNEEFDRISFEGNGYLLTPDFILSYPPTEEVSSADLQIRQSIISNMINAHRELSPTHIECLREAYYFLPMLNAITLSQRGHYDAALKWYRTIYDYTQDSEQNRKLYTVLELEASANNPDIYSRTSNWLLDPLNPHKIASTRTDSYYRYTLYNLSQTFIAYADSQFTLDTIESVSKAEELYEFAHDLIAKSGLEQQRPNVCNIKIFEATATFLCDLPEWAEYIDVINRILAEIPKSKNSQTVANEIDQVLAILRANASDPVSGLLAAENFVENLQNPVPKITLGQIGLTSQTHIDDVMFATMNIPHVVAATNVTAGLVKNDYVFAIHITTASNQQALNGNTNFNNWAATPKQSTTTLADELSYPFLTPKEALVIKHGYSNDPKAPLFQAVSNNPIDALNTISNYQFPYIPFINAHKFCIPANPVFRYLNMSAELNLFKIRNCMNIAGMKRELDPYAAPTDLYTGLPQISSTGQLVIPGGTVIKPTIYRYEYLIERAKQVVNIAQQIEAAFLSALEKRDAEYYNLMKAKQDLATSKANVKLKDLQVNASNDEVDLAVMQKEKSQLQVEELDKMISEGLNGFEQQMIGMYWASASLQATISASNAMYELANAGVQLGSSTMFMIASATAAMALAGVGLGLRTAAEISNAFVNAGINSNSLYASQARREQQWNFEKVLAQQDIRIGNQQVKIAQDRVRISEQDRRISELQQQHAEASIDFLSGKFTNVELYDYMSNVLGNVYRYFLQEANGIAKLAQNQIAFERQEAVQSFIQDDYYENPTDNNAITSPGGNAPDRRGLTGSARLLQDLYKLDQYSFESDKRKLQISKTFSLASLFPMEFEQFKKTGEITFETSMEHFDRDFPGHYLRLIKKVKTSVIALVPPTQGIKATLLNGGISRVVVGGSIYQDVVVRRDPEMVALSGTRDATGVFELQMENPKLLNPFESTGVHSRWQFKMQKAANLFDYSTIADVLITIDYTSLQSFDYEQQVIRSLGTEISSQRAFSMRNEFADQFYELMHPDEVVTPYNTSIMVRPTDFPANIMDVSMSDARWYILLKDIDPNENPFDSTIPTTLSVNLTQATGQVTSPVSFTVNTKGIASAGTLPEGGPIGTWELDFSALENLITEKQIADIILVLTYEGELPKRV